MHLPGIHTETYKERMKQLNMHTKITEKNMNALAAGAKDDDLGLALPSAFGVSDSNPAGGSGVKAELPSLPLVQEQLKAIKRAYLLMSHFHPT